MANTLAGVNLAEIAQESLPYWQNLLAPMSAFTTDFSPEVSQNAESITSRYVIPDTDADDSTSPSSAMYAATAGTTVAVTVPFNRFPRYVKAFSDVERSRSAVDLPALFTNPGFEVLGKKIYGRIHALLTAANFSTSYVSTSGNFDRSDVIDLRATLNKEPLRAPISNRAMLANSDYYASLLKSLNSAEFPGITAEKAEGRVPRVAGFDIYEVNYFPDNTENLGAVALHNSAIVVGSRRIDATGAAQAGVEVYDMLIPGLNMTVQYRRWYVPTEGNFYLSMAALWGAAKGSPFAVRVTSA